MLNKEFEAAMEEGGLDPKKVISDGAVHRFSTWGDRSGERSGAYWHNGRVGWFQDWRTMEKPQVFKVENMSEGDKAALAGSFNGGPAKVSRNALEAGIRKIWLSGTPGDGHPYLIKKGIPAIERIKQYDGRLIIPIFGVGGELNGLQRIDAKGKKRFLAGTRKKGSFFSIPGDNGHYVVCEGFATGVSIHEATGFSVVVAFDAGNLLPVAKQICEKAGCGKVTIAGDNDSWKTSAGGRDIGGKLAKQAGKITGARVVLPVFKNPDGKSTTDFNDLAVMEGRDAVTALFGEPGHKGPEFIDAKTLSPPGNGKPKKEYYSDEIEGYTFGYLRKINYPPPIWVIEDLIPEGVMIFAGKPKIGKSVLVLNLCIAVASGGRYMGKDVEPGAVLYMNLEDRPQRVLQRGLAMLGDDDHKGTQPLVNDNLHIYPKWPRIGNSGRKWLSLFLEKQPRLVVIDTFKMLQKELGKTDQKKTQYEIDYERLASLREICEKHHTTIMPVMHSRKMESEDRVDSISGTLGISGAVDNYMVLREKKGRRAKLFVEGRDIECIEYVLNYTPDNWTWNLVGDAKAVFATEAQQKVYDYMKEFGSKENPLKPSQIVGGSGSGASNVNNRILPKMVLEGIAGKTDHGKYFLLSPS